MLQVFTAHVSYRGPDRLNITALAQDPVGKYFAPTWDLVTRFKKHEIFEEEFESLYRGQMHLSQLERPDRWQELLSRERVILVCFCRPDRFCHRFILANILEKQGAQALGELPVRF